MVRVFWLKISEHLFLDLSLKKIPDMQMDVRDMSFFPDDSFEGVIDKGKWMSYLYKYFVILFMCCNLIIIYFA